MGVSSSLGPPGFTLYASGSFFWGIGAGYNFPQETAMPMITPSAQLTLTKGNKSWSSTAGAAALELVDPLGFGPWLSLNAAAFIFFYFYFFFFFIFFFFFFKSCRLVCISQDIARASDVRTSHGTYHGHKSIYFTADIRLGLTWTSHGRRIGTIRTLHGHRAGIVRTYQTDIPNAPFCRHSSASLQVCGSAIHPANVSI
eukprot:FR734967.1.p1 GENE.FR734967.1~~FR734967.1.p1  ORF type:complete len:199 (-),score=27.71 FR734967.1:233-829(-)